MKKIFLFSVLVFFTGCCASNYCYLPTTEITEMYAEYIDEWKSQARTAFEEAESVVFSVKPKPDVIVGPDEDPAKCVCKGTGVIIQGDGHKTPCPFHSKSSVKSLIIQK